MRAPRVALGAVVALGLVSACEDRPAKNVAAVAPVDAGPAVDKLDGPVSIALPKLTISVAEIDVNTGKTLFATKGCIACHKVGGGKLVGPDLKDIYKRRHEPWIARMILKPEIMLKEDDVAKELFKTHFVPMANQNIDPEKELPFLLAYLKAESK